MLGENLKEVDQELRSLKRCQGQVTIDRKSIDAVYEQLTKNIIKAAEQCLPRKKIHP